MARVTVEDCLDKIPNRFDLVVLASRRARDIAQGRAPFVERENDKPTVIALREIAEGKVDLAYLSARDPGPADLLGKPEEDADSVDTAEALATVLLSDSEDTEEDTAGDNDEDLGEGEARGSEEIGDGAGAEPEANPEESD